MKTLLLSILLVVSVFSFGQVTIIDSDSQINLASDTLVLNIAESNKEYTDYGFISIYFDVTNNTGETKDLIITRSKLNVPTQWSDQICWGFGCYDIPSDAIGSTPESEPANTANGAVNQLKLVINPSDLPGSGHYRYYIVDLNDNKNYLDSVDVVFNFGLASVKEVKKEVLFTINPNPATDYVYVSVNNNNEMDVKIVDVLGNTILVDTMNDSKTINVSQFKNGIYFISISTKDKKVISRKMIVRH